VLRMANVVVVAKSDAAAPADVRRVLVVEDGPTLTHGGMPWGAGHVAALQAGAEIVDPRPFAGPDIRALYARYRHISEVLPAAGYSRTQLDALRQAINATPADIVVSATPIDLAALIQVHKPVVRARYEFAEVETPGLAGAVEAFLSRL